MTSKTPQEALLDQPVGIRSFIASLTDQSHQESFRLARVGSLSAIGDTEIGLTHGPHAFQTLSFAFGDAAEKTLADRNHASTDELLPLVDFLIDATAHQDPSCVLHAVGIMVGEGFSITATHRHAHLTTLMLRLGEPTTGIRAELTWLT
jgi:hypothetical protein